MLPIFFFHTYKSTRQVKKANGLLHSSLHQEGWDTFWTLTVWENEGAMKNYRNAGSHLKAMKISRKIADELEKVNWENDSIPAWEECIERLHQHYGRL
ncbi:antibiotic biosynthesis monooxygenase [Cytobacillus sp. IB215316]|uniref:antibiotic biosynthesis monooxygenase n=1 Tax=Cytobacillus sp. IB215316 TaxID=3097354 RepID=UPI002A151977|nr:antibiotic biosynthesis monooxygenase [Cytobacillus sp. IB215316]MDX8361462.1 DUF3291 domain-containing protein [Cytobacillus sp. IB215316]